MKILPNGVAVIEGDTFHAAWCAESGLVHDRWSADNICRHIKPGDVVIDGGANIGTLTLPMLEAGAHVWAFEPNQDAHSCLIHNCVRFADHLRAIPAALSDKWGPLTLHVDASNAGASFVGSGQDGVYTPATDLDHYRLKPTLIKLDVEGYEVKALNGARDTIALMKPVLIVEVNRGALERAGDSDDALFELIESMGYSWRILQPDCKRGDAQFDVECLPPR